MKKLLLLTFLLGCLGATAQNVIIPDANFKAALLAHDPVIDTNGDDEIQVSEAEAFTGFLNLNSKSIADDTGLEAFVNIHELNLADNPLGSIDLSQNTLLEALNIQALFTLTSIDLSANTALITLTADNGGLTSLDLSQNVALEYVNCGNDNLSSLTFGNSSSLKELQVNQTSLESVDLSTLTGLEDLSISGLLTSLDLSQNTQLQQVNAAENNLTSIDVSNNANLQHLNVESNQLTSLDITGNPLLVEIGVYNNLLTEADFSQNPLLEYVYADENDLYGFNIANGNNGLIDEFVLSGNPNLTCITVDDVAYAQANFTQVDVGVSFSTSCPNYENDILTFTFAGISGEAEINAGEHAVDVVAEAGTDISAISPTISVSQNASISPNTGVEQDFTTTVTYTVTAEDGTTQNWDVTITEELATPTDIILSATSVDENSAPGTVVSMLSAADANFNETFTFHLVEELESDWLFFDVSGNSLITTDHRPFDFENQNSFIFKVEVRDSESATYIEEVTITLNDVNEAPTNIQLTNKSINESNPIGTLIGILTTEDVDGSDTHSYTVVDGCNTCRTEESSYFEIVGNELRSKAVFDFETLDGYGIGITSTDAGGLSTSRNFVVTINDLLAQVTSLVLDNNTVNENDASNSLVGNLSTFGEDLSGNYTYSFASILGNNDDDSFTISGDQLFASESFDFETKSSYELRIRTDDGLGNNLTRGFVIVVNDVSEAPTDIMLSTASLAENNSINDVIGIFSTTDEDSGETHTYSLVSGAGDADNSSFSINGSELQAAQVFDFETKNSYAIRVQTGDGNGGTYQEAFTIAIISVNETISVTAPLADQSLSEGFASLELELISVFTDQDGDALTYSVTSSNEAVVTASVTGSTLTLSEVGFGSSTITVAADDGSGITTSDEFIVTVEEAALGIADELQIIVYPNPVSDFINVVSDQSLSIRVVDVQGQKVLNQMSGQNVTIDVRRFSQGTYLLMIRGEGVNTTRRFIKTN
ncbi:MAG: T9SS type A sorting domain-containing protein [Cyclobacteriaceae bacterium]